MKKTILIVILSVIASTGVFAQSNKQPVQTDSVKAKYTCPMHPEVISDTAGKCPKCGMALVQKKITTEKAKKYTCGMHPDVISDTPGRCPVCGMGLVEKKN